MVIVDDGKGVDKVGAHEGINGLWQEFSCTSSVLGPVSKVTNQFACGCCTDIKGKKRGLTKKQCLRLKYLTHQSECRSGGKLQEECFTC